MDIETGIKIVEYIFAGIGVLTGAGLLSAKYVPNTMLEAVLAKFYRWAFSKVPEIAEKSWIGFLQLNVKIASKIQKEQEDGYEELQQ